MMNKLKITCLVVPLLLSACATMPNGPSTMALPGTGKSFDQFRADDANCRQYSQTQVGGTTANQASDASFAKTAALGTVIGALVGAAAGGHDGVAVGAATGLAMGSVAGAGESNDSGEEVQSRYNHAYVQCMYASGNRVPVSGNFRTAPATSTATYYPPPPPAGYRGAVPKVNQPLVPPDYKVN